MTAAFILLLIGLICVYVEFFLPGAIFGSIGALFLFSSVIVFAENSPSLIWVLLFIVAACLLIAGAIKAALVSIKKRPSSLYSNKDQEGYVASTWDLSLVGKTGIVLSDLKPGGHITIEGKKQAALSKSGYIAKGESVIVVGGEGDSLIVNSI